MRRRIPESFCSCTYVSHHIMHARTGGGHTRATRTHRRHTQLEIFKRSSEICELFVPLQSPGAEIPEKWGKITKFPSPVRPPKMGKNCRKITKKCIFGNFSVIFAYFRGSDRGGEFCNFSPFSGDFHPGGFRGSVRGKTTRKARLFFSRFGPSGERPQALDRQLHN